MNLAEVADDICRRLLGLFQRRQDGKRPVYGEISKFQDDPHWRDYIQFHEYFHGDSGAGIGASHQTGWTALVVALAAETARREMTAKAVATSAQLKEVL